MYSQIVSKHLVAQSICKIVIYRNSEGGFKEVHKNPGNMIKQEQANYNRTHHINQQKGKNLRKFTRSRYRHKYTLTLTFSNIVKHKTGSHNTYAKAVG